MLRSRVGVECYMAEFEGSRGQCKESTREMGLYGARRVKTKVAENQE